MGVMFNDFLLKQLFVFTIMCNFLYSLHDDLKREAKNPVAPEVGVVASPVEAA